jgi:hypothetical protein
MSADEPKCLPVDRCNAGPTQNSHSEGAALALPRSDPNGVNVRRRTALGAQILFVNRPEVLGDGHAVLITRTFSRTVMKRRLRSTSSSSMPKIPCRPATALQSPCADPRETATSESLYPDRNRGCRSASESLWAPGLSEACAEYSDGIHHVVTGAPASHARSSRDAALR